MYSDQVKPNKIVFVAPIPNISYLTTINIASKFSVDRDPTLTPEQAPGSSDKKQNLL